MLYVGLDVHEKYTQIQAMDAAGFLAMTENIPTTAESLGSFFGHLPDPLLSEKVDKSRRDCMFMKIIDPLF